MEQMKFKIDIPKDRKGYWVELHSPHLLHELKMIEIDLWVKENRLGKRMAFNMWKLKNEKARNWFILKWS
jgi:hypothetical protein